MKGINHLSLIMDGNGRWASEQGLSRARGHIAGARKAFEIITYVRKIGIPTLSLFAFSLENRLRPATEVTVLMNLVAHTLQDKLRFFHSEGIKLKVIGDIRGLPNQVRKSIYRAEEETAGNRGLNLLLAINYSGQYDICQAAERWARDKNQGAAAAELQDYLLTAGYENPDLLIRTGGECRISNFFLWQSAYSEIHFQKKYWPDFQLEDLEKHAALFAKTERRFGRTGGS